MKHFKEKYGPWAVITGSSAGIGLEFARQVAAAGVNVVLVARRENLLARVAMGLEGEFGIRTRTVAVDLRHPDFAKTLQTATEDLEIGLLVNNAGTGLLGNFLNNDIESELGILDLNTRVPLVLSHLYGNKMAERGRGGIVFLSSMVAFMGVPRFAHYTATKAYDLLFAESLNYEMKEKGVDVVTLLPGFTESEFMSKMDISRLPMPIAKTPFVVRKGLRKLGRGSLAVPGLMNKMMYRMGAWMPREVNTAMMGMMMKRIEMKDAQPTPELAATPSRADGRA